MSKKLFSFGKVSFAVISLLVAYYDENFLQKSSAPFAVFGFLGFVFWPEMVAGFKMIVRRSKNEK
ncbi:MAG: hypothetical protein KC451_04290 [Amylibacter sp.]|jgi:hypothetical protein|nr:hypothetical protein [Amylibacter sp.]